MIKLYNKENSEKEKIRLSKNYKNQSLPENIEPV